MNMKTWWQRNKFPLLLSLLVISIEAGIVFVVWQAAPPGTHWLGDTINNSSDIAVYLSYLKQGSQGHILLKDLYAVEPNATRLDPYWSSLALLARSGINLILLLEISRWLTTLFLIFALYAAAKAIASTEKDARLATLLSVLGFGLGWTFTFWMYAFGKWGFSTIVAADVTSEFSIPWILGGGTHIILSAALLITGLRLTWQAVNEDSLRRSWLAMACWGLLLSFHPYFAPLFIIYCILTLAQARFKIKLKNYLVLACSFIPAVLIYAPLAFDTVFRNHHLLANNLELPPFISWIFTLLPFGVAVWWRYARKIKIGTKEYWVIAWMLSAVICMILPFPWKRKYLECLGPALILLTLPFWSRVKDRLLSRMDKLTHLLFAPILLLAVGLNTFHILTTQLAWIEQPSKAVWFFRPNETFAAWSYLSRDTSAQIIVTDDFWINCWTPPYSGKTVWVGHDHETPDYHNKMVRWNELMQTSDAAEAQSILSAASATDLLLTSTTSTARFEALLAGTSWTQVFQSGTVTILERH